MVKKNYYAIHLPAQSRGIYTSWNQVKPLVTGQHSEHKGFETRQEAAYFCLHGLFGERMPVSSRPGPESLPRFQINRPTTTRPQPSGPSRHAVRRHLPSSLGAEQGETLDEVGDENSLAKYYAVARGRKIGLYDSWYGDNGARNQTDGFRGSTFQKFEDRDDAIHYLCDNGIPRSEIRLFRETLKPQLGFKPRPSKPVNEEIKRLLSSQHLEGSSRREAVIDALRNLLIQYLLPEGISVDQEDEEEGLILTDAQTLKIYQEICRRTKRSAKDTINRCLLELKKAPYVNIFDFIGACRTNTKPKTFTNWTAFCSYTTQPGMRIDLTYAKKNELLAPLLQDLRSSNGGSHDPIAQRRRLLLERNRRMGERGLDPRSFNVSIRTEQQDPTPTHGLEFRSGNRTSSSSVAVGPRYPQSGFSSPEQEDSYDSEAGTEQEDSYDSEAGIEQEYSYDGEASIKQEDLYDSEAGTESVSTAESTESESALEPHVHHQILWSRSNHICRQFWSTFSDMPPSIADTASEDLSQDETYGHILIKQESEGDVEPAEENVEPTRLVAKRARVMEDQRLLPRKRRRGELDNLKIDMNI